MSDHRVPMVPAQRMADQKHCFSCGRVLHVTAAACPYCGAAQPQAGLPATAPHVGIMAMSHAAFCTTVT